MRPSGFVMTMILIGLGTGGCSFSRNDTSAYAKADDNDLTGSIARLAKEAVPTETKRDQCVVMRPNGAVVVRHWIIALFGGA